MSWSVCLFQENIYFRVMKRANNAIAFLKGFFLLIKTVGLTIWYYFFSECKTFDQAKIKAVTKLFTKAYVKRKK